MALSPRRLVAAGALLLCLLAGLGVRLHRLQFGAGPRLAAAALAQRSQALRLPEGRGEILDRNGLPLLDPRLRWVAIAFPALLRAPGALDEAAAVLGIDPARLADALRRNEPAVVADELSPAALQRLLERPVPGLVAHRRLVRRGPAAQAGHLIGWLRDSDGVPVSGLELQYDEWLRAARPPAVGAVVDALGRLLPGAGVREVAGARGGSLVLTIDARWQRAAEAALVRQGRRGAAVVLDPRSGELLAAASWPPLPQDWLNRATSAFPTGSVFKIVVAAAAWEEGLDGLDALPDPERGLLDLKAALVVSSNPAFQAVGRRLGGQRLLEYARRFGLGQVTELALPGEAPGSLPEPWELRVGDVGQLSIGQGPLTATPLQMAKAMAAVANDGVAMPLRVVREYRTPAGRPQSAGPEAAGAGQAPGRKRPPAPVRLVSADTARRVRDALEAVVAEGTGRDARVAGVTVAGKTGTAEAYDAEAGEWISHAWFVGYAPADAPQVVVAVFAQRGVSGGLTAAPVFAEIVAAGFGLDAIAER